MKNIHEILAQGKPISPEKLKLIENQLAQRDAKRAERQASPEKAAQRTALELFPHIQELGVGMSNPDNVAEASLAYHALHNQPIPLVGFWGIGEKEEMDSLDADYVDRLVAKRKHVSNHYNHGAQITIILANMHGVFNGYISDNLQSPYLDEVDEALYQHGIQTVWLNQLYHDHGLQLPEPVDINDHTTETETYWVFLRHQQQYTQSAQRHHMNDAEAKMAGFKYVEMRMRERQMLAQEFQDSFLIVNGTKMTAEPLMPKTMPVLYVPEGPVWFRRGAPLK